jgi:hypothetical protein
MKIKPQTFLRFLLSIPYFAWAVALLFSLLLNGPARNTGIPNSLLDALTTVTSFYTIGIVIWGIPYTILTVGLLLWSRNKPAPAIYKVFLFSPLLLSGLTVVEVALISLLTSQAPSLEGVMDFLSFVLIAVIPTLLFGYVFVGVGVIINKAMKQFNLLRIEDESK